MNPLARKGVELALVEQLRRLPPGTKPNMREIRLGIGCTRAELAGAVQSLRYQGKPEWDRLALSPSMIEQSDGPAGPPEAEGGAVAPPPPSATSPAGPDDEDDYPGEVNDAGQASGPGGSHPRQQEAAGFVPKALLHRAGVHAASTRAAAKPIPAPEHEPEIARLVREEVNETSARRYRARSTGTVRQPLELRKFGLADLNFAEGVASLLAETPHDLMVAVSRRHPQLWRRVLLLGRSSAERPAQALYAAIERGLDELEAELPHSEREQRNVA